MAVTTYTWTKIVEPFVLNTYTAGSQQLPAITASAAGISYFGSWSQANNSYSAGRFVGSGGVPISAEFSINSTATNLQFDPSMATLGNGNYVVAFTDTSTDAGGDIRLRLFAANGSPIGNDSVADAFAGTYPASNADVAALTGGGFVVTWQANDGGNDNQIHLQRFNADGSTAGGALAADDSAALNTNSPSVAGLTNGGFVIAWQQEPVAGGDTEICFRRFNANGSTIGSTVVADTVGSINEDMQLVGLADGGFAMAYADNGWLGSDVTEIALRIYNADGSARTGVLRANANMAGEQSRPTITALSNGFIVVGWSDTESGQVHYQIFDPSSGAALGSIYYAAEAVIEGESAALGLRLASVYSSDQGDGSGNAIRSVVHELTRIITGDDTGETLHGDGMRDIITGGADTDNLYGHGGNDSLSGGGGDDNLYGGTGDDIVDGGAGSHDFTNFSADAVAGVTVDLAIIGPQAIGGGLGTDTLTNIEDLGGSDYNDVLSGNDAHNWLWGQGGADTLRGRGGHDYLYGGDNDDTLEGGDGDDRLMGGAGDNILDGGANIDTADYNGNAVAGVTVNLAASSPQAIGGGYGSDTLISIESVAGSGYNDMLSGGDGSNSLYGRGGADTLYGRGGVDYLYGGDDGDFLEGGGGADTIDGGAGSDTLSFMGAATGMTLQMGSINPTTGQVFAGEPIGNDTFSNIEHVLCGNAADTVGCDGNGNFVAGFGGDDTIFGWTGNDTLWGGENNDQLFGQQDNDIINGDAGNDKLFGWAGNDTLTGGSGADSFMWTGAGEGTDIVTDYSYAQGDLIDVVGNPATFSFYQAGTSVLIIDPGTGQAIFNITNYELSNGLAIV